MRAFVFASLVGVLAVGACAGLAFSSPDSGGARAWPMSADEADRLVVLRLREREILEVLAPVVTGTTPDRVLALLVPRLRALQERDEALVLDARRRCGVAVVASGSSWVERPR